MSLSKILVPTDGSRFTKDAMNTAIEMAKLSSGQITALYVVDRAGAGSVNMGGAVESITEELNREGERAIGEVKAACEAAGVPCDTKMVGGNPAECIVKESDAYDIIVMSTLGKTGLSRILIGSVAEKVVRTASCKVLTVRGR